MKLKPLTTAAIGLTAAGAAYVLVHKRRATSASESTRAVEIHGFVSPGYEAVRDAFAENESRDFTGVDGAGSSGHTWLL